MKTLEQLIKERDEYLKQNPHLVPLQKEIDQALSVAGTPKERLAVIKALMQDRVEELQEQFEALLTKVKELKE